MEEQRRAYTSAHVFPYTMKIISDGTVEEYSALLFDEYLDGEGGLGIEMLSPSDMELAAKLAAEKGFLSYGRFLRSGEATIVMINMNTHEVTRGVCARLLGIPEGACLKRLVETYCGGVAEDDIEYTVQGGMLVRTLGHRSAAMMRYVYEI